MKFKELSIWQTFEFDESDNPFSLGLAQGPWVKVSARRYRKDTNPFSADYVERVEHIFGVNHLNQVGSINVEVKAL